MEFVRSWSGGYHLRKSRINIGRKFEFRLYLSYYSCTRVQKEFGHILDITQPLCRNDRVVGEQYAYFHWHPVVNSIEYVFCEPNMRTLLVFVCYCPRNIRLFWFHESMKLALIFSNYLIIISSLFRLKTWKWLICFSRVAIIL